jgi:hypothetical protein
MKLRDVLPREATEGPEYDGARVLQLLDEGVAAEMDGRDHPWPGRHKNVLTWWRLKSGLLVGWNENPSVGWSFPVIRDRATAKCEQMDLPERADP